MTKSTPKVRDRLDPLSYNEFVDKYHDESDRAAAVLAGCYLDSFLEGALRSVLVPGKRVDDQFEGQGILSTLGSKIAFTYGLGLASEATARDMDLIRKVRNRFAHDIWDTTFDTSPVSDWCRKIAIVDKSEPYDGPLRLRYLMAVALCTGEILLSSRIPTEFFERVTWCQDYPKALDSREYPTKRSR